MFTHWILWQIIAGPRGSDESSDYTLEVLAKAIHGAGLTQRYLMALKKFDERR